MRAWRIRSLQAACVVAGWVSLLPGTAVSQPATSSATAASATARALRAAGFSRVSEDKGIVRATVYGDSLWEIAGVASTGTTVDRHQAMVAIFRANPHAFVGGNVHRIEKGVSLVIPPLSQMRAEDARLAVALVAQHRQAYGNRSVVPAALYPLVVSGAASATAKTTPVLPAASGPAAERVSRSVAVTLPAPEASLQTVSTGIPGTGDALPSSRTSAQPSARESGPQGEAPTAVNWWPAVALLLLGGAGMAVFLRRRAPALPDEAAASAEHASRLFADSRLDLESQLEAQPNADSEPLYSTLDEPVDAVPAQPAPQAVPTVKALVLRNGRAGVLEEAEQAGDHDVGGEALALALTVAHAYADVGRPEAARRWLRAIDTRGAAAFTPAG